MSAELSHNAASELRLYLGYAFAAPTDHTLEEAR